MKQEKNNEIDLLLRSLARGGRGESSSDMRRVSTRGSDVLSNHLDADELNSFAEGVLPTPAQERYTAHLADCERCRGFVIKLMQTSGATVRPEGREQQTAAGFWNKMAALFSPPVLRYAVPVLALTAVVAISFLAFRQQRGPDLVAKNESNIPAAEGDTNEKQVESFVSQPSVEPAAKLRSGAESAAQADSDRSRSTLKDEKGNVPAASDIANAGAPTQPSLKDSSQTKQGYTLDSSRPVFAPEPQAAPAPPPKTALSEADKNNAIQKEEITRREVQALPREEAKTQPRDEAGRHGPARSNTVLPGSKRAEGLMTESRNTMSKSKKDSEDEEVETRTVSGRRFRRQGSLWIDTAYDSTRKTINVSRGSEQFRALVADEPAIRTISEKLSGVVIVLWKSRAYRIQ